jgi:hypothetical protein
VPQGRAVGVKKKNGTEQIRMLLLDVRAQNSQDLRQRGLRPDHAQHGVIEQR